jgi:type II secretory pathway component PulL
MAEALTGKVGIIAELVLARARITAINLVPEFVRLKNLRQQRNQQQKQSRENSGNRTLLTYCYYFKYLYHFFWFNI